MDTLLQTFNSDSVAHTLLMISLVAALGLALGQVRVLGVKLGVAGVLFMGLLLGHFQVSVDEPVLGFLREFGLVLFVYAIGLQVGPGFAASFRQEGLPLNLMAAGVVGLGLLGTWAAMAWGDIPLPAALGLFSGATTNTPSLAAAQQALKEVPNLPAGAVQLPTLSYALAYPFGVIGSILSMILVRAAFRIDPKKELAELLQRQEQDKPSLAAMNVEVTNPNLEGLALNRIPGLEGSGVVVSRVMRESHVGIPSPDMPLRAGDILLAVGPREKLRDLQVVVGRESPVDLRKVPSGLMTRRILVTKRAVLGKTVEELDLTRRLGVIVTRLSRMDIEMAIQPGLRLKFGDTLLAVGDEEDLRAAAKELGNSAKQLNDPQIIPLFLGVALGLVLGHWPIPIPGLPAPVKLGLAGGPLMAAIFLSRVGRIGPLVWHMPISANFLLRELGIVLFLACVGLRSGDRFVETLLGQGGWAWMLWGAGLTLIPLLIVGAVGRALYKFNYVTLCGLLSGSMTDPPALAFANAFLRSDAPGLSYATVYPLTMLLRVFAVQVLVLLFLS